MNIYRSNKEAFEIRHRDIFLSDSHGACYIRLCISYRTKGMVSLECVYLSVFNEHAIFMIHIPIRHGLGSIKGRADNHSRLFFCCRNGGSPSGESCVPWPN